MFLYYNNLYFVLQWFVKECHSSQHKLRHYSYSIVIYLVNNVNASVQVEEVHFVMFYLMKNSVFAKFESLAWVCCYCWRLMLVSFSAQRLIFCSCTCSTKIYRIRFSVDVVVGVAGCLGNEEQLKSANQSFNRIWILWSIYAERDI